MFHTALSAYRNFPKEEQSTGAKLHRMFAEMEFELSHPNTALRILISMTDDAVDPGNLEVFFEVSNVR